MHDAVYRMVVNVLSTSNEPDVFLGTTDAPLAGDPWQEGWHPGVVLDYVTTLGVTKSQFTDSMQADAVARVMDSTFSSFRRARLGLRDDLFSGGGTGKRAAHTFVHRNLTESRRRDPVLTPETAPHYLLTAFPEQTF